MQHLLSAILTLVPGNTTQCCSSKHIQALSGLLLARHHDKHCSAATTGATVG